MSVLLGVVVGVLAVRLLVGSAHELLHAPALEQTNHRGRSVPTSTGVLAIVAVVLVEGGRSLFGAFGVGSAPGDSARVLILVACVGFGLLGLFDDLAGTQTDHGFRGHVLALTHGRVTTGAVKMVGGAALAIVLVSVAAGSSASGVRVIADALVVALAANLANLFDRAPGRAIKVGLLAWVPFALIARAGSVGVAVAPVLGAFVGLLGDDLHERLMLGDAGANALGAALGLAVVLQCSTTTRSIVLAVLVVFSAASEWLSFGEVIERVGLLRRFDELGRGA